MVGGAVGVCAVGYEARRDIIVPARPLILSSTA